MGYIHKGCARYRVKTPEGVCIRKNDGWSLHLASPLLPEAQNQEVSGVFLKNRIKDHLDGLDGLKNAGRGLYKK